MHVAAYDPGCPGRFEAEQGPHRPRALWFYKPACASAAQHTHHLHLTDSAGDIAIYTAGKRAFVAGVLASAGIHLRPRTANGT